MIMEFLNLPLVRIKYDIYYLEDGYYPKHGELMYFLGWLDMYPALGAARLRTLYGRETLIYNIHFEFQAYERY